MQSTIGTSDHEYPFLSAAVPCFNEQRSIRAFYEQLSAVLRAEQYRYEILFVDDGSTDHTLEILKDIAALDTSIRVLSLSKNFGHQIALTAALDHADGEYVAMLDSDLQHPPRLIPTMLRLCQEGYDVVYGVRRVSEGAGIAKRLSSALYYGLFNGLSGTQITPGAADFRVMSRRAVRVLRGMRERHRLLRGMVPWMGLRSASITFDAPPRMGGGSRYTFLKMVSLGLRGILSFSTIPLLLIAVTGLAAAILGFVYGIYVLGRWLLVGDLAVGWGSTMSVVLLMGGLQLISVGVIAVYVGMILEEAKGRPLYVLDRIIGGEGAPDAGEAKAGTGAVAER